MPTLTRTASNSSLHIRAGEPGELRLITIEDPQSSLEITLDEGVSASVPLLLQPREAACLHTLEVVLGKNSSFELLVLQGSTANSLSIQQRCRVGEGAKLHCVNVSLGSLKLTHDLRSEILGMHGESTLDWVVLAKGSEHKELSVRNVFLSPHGRGTITMKGVAEDRARVQCNGGIEIGPKGSGTQTYLTQDVLMLDPSAKVDAVPGLEIKTDDVQASHSATVSCVSPEDLFYFASRGIPRKQAREMYVDGFLKELVEHVEPEHQKLVLEKLSLHPSTSSG